LADGFDLIILIKERRGSANSSCSSEGESVGLETTSRTAKKWRKTLRLDSAKVSLNPDHFDLWKKTDPPSRKFAELLF
jgi:hypothetical protein